METSRGTRDQILDAAERLFGRRGYANVTINQVCEASGLPVGSVYHHFGSKSGVLRAVLERGLSSFFDELGAVGDVPGLSPREHLTAHFDTAADLIAKRIPLFRLFTSLLLHQPDEADVQAIIRENVERGDAWFATFIEPVAASCGVRDPAACAKEMGPIGLVVTTGLMACIGNTSVDIKTGIGTHLHRLVLATIFHHAEKSAGRAVEAAQ